MKKLSHFALMAPGIFLCGIASAQNNVELFGRIDTYVAASTNNPAATARNTSGRTLVTEGAGGLSGPRWGIRGSEDISPDLKAIFWLENGFNSDTGAQADSTRLFNRQAYVGLAGNWGSLTLGRQYTPLFDINLEYAPQKHAPLSEPVVTMTGGGGRNDNTVKYVGKYQNLTFSAYRAFGEVPGSATAKSSWGSAVNYATVTYGVALAVDESSGSQGLLGIPKAERALLTGAYNVGKVRLSAGYRWERNQGTNLAVAQRDNLYWTGARIPVAPATTLVLAYYYQDNKAVSAAKLVSPSQFATELIYSLSKRTDLYGTAVYSHNGSINLGPESSLAPGANSQATMAIGIRHIF